MGKVDKEALKKSKKAKKKLMGKIVLKEDCGKNCTCDKYCEEKLES